MLKLMNVVLDCPGPLKLATFYAELTGGEISYIDDEWADVAFGQVDLSFQKVTDYRPPHWPGQDHPQQFHLDFAVDEFKPEQQRAVKLGATLHKEVIGAEGYGWQVFLDPAGHPFCLCRNKPQ